MNRIALERVIEILDTLYEDGQECVLPKEIAAQIGTGCTVTDLEYDGLRRQLKEIAPDSYIFKQVTASQTESSATKVEHRPPMVSISKACHEDPDKQAAQLAKWLDDCGKEASRAERYPVHKGKLSYLSGYFSQSYKLDGVAIALYYEKGKLVRAGLRPRSGIIGEDVTEQVAYVSGIPKKLKEPITCSIRGELVCLKSDFEKVQKWLESKGEPTRANPRNHAAGGIRQYKTPSKVADMKLSFIAYTILNQEDAPYDSEIDRAKYCESLGVPHVKVSPFVFEDLAELENKAKLLDYETDGVVISVNDLTEQEALGRTGDATIGNPKGKIAWKFAEERATPTITGLEWQCGRSGELTPVACFNAVELAGTKVSRATLHNIGFMMRGSIGVGTKIVVIKSGKIIPKVIEVLDGKVKNTDYPKTCPSCGHNTAVEQNGDMHALMCNNQACPARNIGGLLLYLATFGVLGLGESKVTSLVAGGKVKTPSDFYKLTVNDCVECWLSERQSLLAIASIHMVEKPDQMDDVTLLRTVKKAQEVKKVVPLWKLFGSMGIPSAGRSCGKSLVSHFGNFDSIRNASVADLSAVKDVGAKTAQIIHDFLAEHCGEIDDLLRFVEPELPVQGKLTGKIFCLSGSFVGGKKGIESKIEAFGGKVAGIGKSCSYLLQGTDPGADKEEKAKKYSVPIITESDLEKMLK